MSGRLTWLHIILMKVENLLMQLKLALLMAILVSGAPAAQAVLIDFNDGVAGDIIDSLYTDQGVIFSNAERVTNFGLSGSTGPYGISAIGAYQWFSDNPVIAYFSSDITDVSIIGVDVGENGLQLTAYDSEVGGNLRDLAQVFGTDLGNNQFFTLSVSAHLIKRVEIYQIQHVSIDGIVVEDLKFFNRASVPLPATAWLILIGLAGWRVTCRTVRVSGS